MSWYNVGMRAGKRSPLVYVVAGVVGGLVLMAAAYQSFLTIPILLDGKELRVTAGTRVSDLVGGGRVHGKPGNLIAAVDAKVLKAGGGLAAYVAVNGSRVGKEYRLNPADDVRSMNGSDAVEPLQTRTEPIEAPVRYEGTGPLQSVVATGEAGTKEITIGSVSKQVVETRVVKEATPRVVRRHFPPKGAKYVALTFDDGPWPKSTLQVLGVLKKYGVRASFFMLGGQARRRPDVAKAVADAGMLVCNHSQSHPNMARMSFSAIASQIQQSQDAIEKATGQRPRYFRPPYGATSPHMGPILKKQGLTMVQWDVDSLDWRKPPWARLVNRTVSSVKPGSVVLFHDGGGDRRRTVDALPAIIEKLKKAGYLFVTLDEMTKLPDTMG